jgi:hypothetical protein
MPQFNVDLSPKNQPTSLADLLKLQAYSAQADVAQIEAAKAKAIAAEQKEIQGFFNFQDGKNWKNDQGEIDVDKINAALPVIAPLTGHEYASRYNQLAKNNTDAKDAKLNFDQKERNVVASVYSALGYAGVTDPRVYMDKLNNLKNQFPESKNIHRYADAAISNLRIGAEASKNQPNPNLPKTAIQSANEMLSLTEQQSRFAPSAALTTVGGQTAVTTTTPSTTGNKPVVEVAPLGGGGNGNAPTPATKTTSKMPKILAEDESLGYVPNQSGIVNLNDYQKNAYERGDKSIANANASLQAQKDLQQSVRKVEEYIGKASGSKIFQMIRQGQKYVFGDAELDSLVKNIAQVQARNASVMGLDKTDSSRELNAKLSGSENIDEKTLAGVMQQVKAESKAAEMFTEGLNKFVDKRGDINGKIQAQKFESKWKEHYDPRIFQVDDIALSKLPEAEKRTRIDEITSKMTPKEFDKYKKDREVIHRLAKGAYQ